MPGMIGTADATPVAITGTTLIKPRLRGWIHTWAVAVTAIGMITLVAEPLQLDPRQHTEPAVPAPALITHKPTCNHHTPASARRSSELTSTAKRFGYQHPLAPVSAQLDPTCLQGTQCDRGDGMSAGSPPLRLARTVRHGHLDHAADCRSGGVVGVGRRKETGVVHNHDLSASVRRPLTPATRAAARPSVRHRGRRGRYRRPAPRKRHNLGEERAASETSVRFRFP